MNRSKLKTYAPQARRDFIQAVTDRAAVYGLTPSTIEPITEQGDVAIIGGKPFPIGVAAKRRRLEERIKRHGFAQVMEAMAYTWFNRLVAIRYMEIHGYLDHGYRVLSNPNDDLANAKLLVPEIVEHAEHVDLPGLDKTKAIELKLEGTKEAELYRMLLLAQCHALHKAMPFLFERIDDETELLLPDNLLHSDSIIRKLVSEIEEADWQAVEIIGWLYQFYISEKKDEVIGKVVRSEDIPAATQLFTPNWIVKYLVQNSLGRQWLATYPQSALKSKMEYYIEPAEQTPEIQGQLKAITPESLNPEELTLMDPACGSGHILVEAYDLLKEIYLERGYRLRDIPRLILSKNLFGLEIDDRAAQLAAFALMMKARADDRRIFDGEVGLNVLAIQESNGLNLNAIMQAFTEKRITHEGDLVRGEFGFMGAERVPLFATENSATATVDDKLAADLKAVFALFENAKTFGSLITVPKSLRQRLPELTEAVTRATMDSNLAIQRVANSAKVFLVQTILLSRHYDAVVTNPPYMGSLFPALKRFAELNYKDSKTDLYGMFMDRTCNFTRSGGYTSLVTMHGWMFSSHFERLRRRLIDEQTIVAMAHLGARAFDSISGEIVQTTAFVLRHSSNPHFVSIFQRLIDLPSELEKATALKSGVNVHRVDTTSFSGLPGVPLCYWASQQTLNAFVGRPLLASQITVRTGMSTGDNARFVRCWHEVDLGRVGLRCQSRLEAAKSGRKWFPFKKGGTYRRWYGNNDFVVDYEEDGKSIKSKKTADLAAGRITPNNSKCWNEEHYFKASVTWTKVSSSAFAVRIDEAGTIFSDASNGVFPSSQLLGPLAAYLNSHVAELFLTFLSPTLNAFSGDIGRLPMPGEASLAAVKGATERLVALARVDWDEMETSWDFSKSPFMIGASRIQESCEAYQQLVLGRRNEMRLLEEETCKVFATEFGLGDEVVATIDEQFLSVQIPTMPLATQFLLSYSTGCAMGRFALDKPGLIYANNGNEGFDPRQYKSFPADKDGIIPVTEIDWFPDAAARRFEEFVGVAWPKEHLDENLKFVAHSLGTKNGEQPHDTIRRYFANDFYKHHLQTYKRRPIYWLFTSGKLGAFQCLVYLHRYNEGTLARMRTEYVIPLQGKINARIDQLEGDKDKATAPAHRKRLEKEQELLKKQQAELVKFDEKLRHYADQRIKLDLDDGVKVNYAKFGDLLACVTQVCGKAEDDE